MCMILQVVSVNFHPFYRNAKEVVKKELFQVNYSSIIVQQDIFAQKTENLKTVSLYACHLEFMYACTGILVSFNIMLSCIYNIFYRLIRLLT